MRTAAVRGGVRPVVWVVDDVLRDAHLARGALEPECDVHVFLDGSVALEQLASRAPPDVLVLDWMMPGLTGIELVRFLRSEGVRLAQLPVLLLTAHHAPDQIVEGLAAGANDYLAKPFNDEELRARVHALLRSARLLERAQAAEKALRGLLDNAPDALLVVDAQGVVQFANDEAVRAFDRPLAHIAGRPVRELVPDLAQNSIDVGGGEPLLPLPDVTINGRTWSPSFRVLPTDTAASTTIALRDVTDRRRAEQKRLDFYSVIAHDLRSPLNAMILRTQVMLRGRRGPLSSEVVGDLQVFDRNLRAMVAMINDFLDLARLEGTGYKISRDALDLRDVVTSTVEELRPLAEANRLRLRWEPPADSMQVLGDRPRLAQVLSNLVGNALKYTPAGGAVQVSVDLAGDIVETRVRDTGPGISAELRSHIFKRFARAPEQKDTIGSGLGLMIVREIVEAHGGTVGVESEPGDGSTFWFRLPCAAPPVEPAHVPQDWYDEAALGG